MGNATEMCSDSDEEKFGFNARRLPTGVCYLNVTTTTPIAYLP